MSAQKKVVPSETNVVLLSGGTSGEREISIESGKGAEAALKEAGFSVTTLDPADHDDLITLVNGHYDVAFLCLHGKGGEDGSIQGLLEILGIPYTGPGIWSSATAMDKSKSKVFYELAGIHTPQSITLHSKDELTSEQIVEKLGQDIVIKPADEGSALGVSIIHNADGIDQALTEAFSSSHEVLIEQFVSGTELTVAVLGNKTPHALPIIEIVPEDSFYDFHSKYAQGGAQHICPAPFDEETTNLIKKTAEKVHTILECRGMSRTDMILDEQNIPWVLETNTIPGMTATSLLPDAGRAAGIDFPELCTRLIEYALEDK